MSARREPGDSMPVNACTSVFLPTSLKFAALMAGAFNLMLADTEALALAVLLRKAAVDARAGQVGHALTDLREEIWTVCATELGTVALVRRAVMLRFSPADADLAADLLERAGTALYSARCGSKCNA